jgi:type I restriction enzyme R subunit
MSPIGQSEKKTQERVVNLFRDTLGYDYLGDWKGLAGNANVEVDLLRAWLEKRGIGAEKISRALYLFGKAVGDTSKTLYDRNAEVYGLLRYGVNFKTDAKEKKADVFLIDWEHPEMNHFAFGRG